MKNANSIGMFFLSMALAASMTACKHRPPMVTDIPGGGGPPRQRDNNSGNQGISPGQGDLVTPQPKVTDANVPLDFDHRIFDTGIQDREKFKANTIYFEFDSATIKPGEEGKMQAVADYLKDHKSEGVSIEGNCDQRGTEKYNLSLGERRALAAREYLVNLGVDATHLKTVTYGASHPVETGHDESAYKMNRRDDFILVTPK